MCAVVLLMTMNKKRGAAEEEHIVLCEVNAAKLTCALSVLYHRAETLIIHMLMHMI